MRKFILGIMVLSFTVYLLAQESADKHQYVGVSKCKTCHKSAKQGEQLGKWEASKHASAYKTLLTEEAAKIAKDKGLDKAPNEAPECLKCHVTGHDADASMKAESFAMEDGVQCESCHGAGSDYRKKSIMKSREESIKNGMAAILVEDGSAEKLCITCHNKESPTYEGFEFKEMWTKIAHPVPETADE
jgi:hypothetical protein